MALYDNPTHLVSIYSVASTRDLGGGTQLTYTLRSDALPCIINTLSSSEREMYAQQGIEVTHTIAFLARKLPQESFLASAGQLMGILGLTYPEPTLSRGSMIVTNDRSESYHVRGIRSGRAYGSIPAFVYADCEQIL